MVSSVLAQAILNQDVPDIVGSFREGEEIARQQKVRELSGQALAGEGIDPLLGEIAPEVALALGEQLRARSAKDISDFLRDAGIARSKLQAGDVQGALQFGMQRRNAIKLRGGDTTQTDEFIQAIQQSPEGALDQLNALFGSLDQAKPAAIIERDRLLQDLKSEDPKVRRSAEIALKLAAPARGGLTPSEQVDLARQKSLARAEVELQTAGDIERLKASQKEAGKGVSARKQGFIDAGVDAADGVSNIKRSLALLDTVKTGGFNSALLRAKQLFGVEGADEGELSANLGRSVLAQLKPIFGAAFTAAEGERLERISEGFGKSPEANRRLLENALKTAERAARRGIKAAEDQGDNFTANEIRDALNSFKGLSNDTPQAPTGGIKFLGFE